ncbi:hypothetical protein [Polyangium spumosum]|uniref:Uncharacterized protein n=1 Tax=Polyangium spumosum TaxID=889282 RepID=A0A6N7Q3U6_9BACT|nr:hypothetical protein [Polyangium spumosum]MRG97305.1 hypothetical protein [Polyangium spumosum]
MSRIGTSLSVALVASSLAFVAGTSAHAAVAPSFSSIPEARVPEMLHPKDAPDAIPAGESLEGVRVEADAFQGKRAFANVHVEGGRCLTAGATPRGVAPSGSAQTLVRAGAVVPMRVERLVERKPGEAELEVVDGWLDARTSSVRKVATTRVPLTTLAKGPASYVVYGLRKGNELQVVIPAQERLGYVDPRGQVGFTQCGHLRIGLDTTATNGAMIMAAGRIRTNRVASPQPARTTLSGSQILPQSRAKPSDVGMRVIQVSVSTSRTKRDHEPLVGVSVGWAEDDDGTQPAVFDVDMHHR